VNVTILAWSIACGGGGGYHSTPVTPAPAQISVAANNEPIPVASEGRVLLVYELVIQNQGGEAVTPQRLEVRSGAAVLEAWEGADLAQRLSVSTVVAGGSAVAFLWLSVDPANVPASLSHTLHATAASGTILAAALEVQVSEERPLAIGPPLRGSNWYAANLSNTSGHRRAILAVDGARRIAQRFAIDWIRVSEAGRTYDGDPTVNASYFAYGQEVLAVADGIVSQRFDGLAENVPNVLPPADINKLAGNHLLIDVGGDRSALYAHMIPGSVRPQIGARVHRGDVLGLVGNSGNSTEPHLHFHIAREFDPAQYSTLDADGLPYVLESFLVQANRPLLGERQAELPAGEAVITFADH
jgi:hypothetical protein